MSGPPEETIIFVGLAEANDGDIIVLYQIEGDEVTDEVWIDRDIALEIAKEIIAMVEEPPM